MAWQEVDNGLWERSLGLSEQGMTAFLPDGKPPEREFILIHCVANFTTSHPTDEVTTALRDSWKALRLLKSPDIATTFHGGKKSYKVPSAEELKAWLAHTFIVEPPGTSVGEATRNRQALRTYSPTCSLLSEPTQNGNFKGTLIFFISHWRTEAAGVFMMMNQMFDFAEDLLSNTTTRQALETHSQGSEVKLLTPVLEDIIFPGKEPSPEAKSRVAQDFAEYYSKLPSVDFPMTGEINAIPSYMKVSQRTYTPTTTASIVKSCKPKDITITAAVHSAYVSAIFELASAETKDRNYVSMMPAQVRTRLPSTSSYRTQGCWDSARMVLLHTPPSQDFLTRASQLKTQYARAASESWLYDDIKHIPITMFSPPADLPPTPPSFPWFTSIGLLDGEVIVPDHGSIKLEYLTFWADSAVPGIVLRLWTFNRKLNIQIQWNAAFHSDNLIEKTLDIIETVLGSELRLDIEVEQKSVEEYNA